MKQFMLESLKEGEIFQARYRILAELGSGGMGSVFLAEQLDAKRRVAIKVLHQLGSDYQDEFNRFIQEFRLLCNLSHENIVTFYSAAITPEGIPYAVSEYLEGRSLSNLAHIPYSSDSYTDNFFLPADLECKLRATFLRQRQKTQRSPDARPSAAK
jgi:serine/threonine protein kinase